ncbi:two-component system response regulator [Aerosakkonema funiforme]|uniref:EAL domain-containing protein n=1 Tax=Aerosakkonema funiforme FACHB-1375 TaxID=2949571 RepID=A0A926VED7_9CYAN|nr:GGDEF domain-containing response regulator [Aerosakkonema funiforme]MBD2182371.1 EAL domain-containing protein [Aerosakkonema funiforme FACHB-1375]
MDSSESGLILIVDDNRTNLKLLFGFLKESGYKILVAINGKNALEKLQYINPDLILLDIRMPDMDGFEVCRYLKANPGTKEIPVIFLTALSDVKDKVEGLNLGAVDYITKPLQKDELLSRIRLHLRLRSLTRNLQEKNELLTQEIANRKAIEDELQQLNQELEHRIAKRTEELSLTLHNLRLREQQLAYEAYHDLLTGLYNRSWLMNRLSEILKIKSSQNVKKYSVLFLDIDRFKNINDSFGHLVGDEFIKNVSIRIKICVGSKGEIARLGGDEFLIILTEAEDLQTVEATAADLLEELQRPFLLGNYQVIISASIGIVFSILDYHSSTAILRDADIAMYQAKQSGKGCYTVLTPQMQSQALERIELETDIRQAIEQEQFCLYYQPIFSIQDKKVVGFEALSRWLHPQHGFISPTKFITIAEEIGLIQILDTWALQSACQQLKIWQEQFNVALTVNVNFSATELQQPGVVEKIIQICGQSGLSLSSVKLEITESGFLQTASAGTNVLKQIRSQGIKLCIDDFGTGYSSLSRLHIFPIDTLKIDRSFISGLGSSSDTTAIVQTIISLAHNLDMDVVAEGIETNEQLEKLKDLGCEFGQGFFFSKPLSSQQVTQLLSNYLSLSTLKI